METKGFFLIWNNHKCFGYLCLIHLNSYARVLRPLEIFLLLQCGDRLYTSESDVYRHQILTTEVDPRAVGVKSRLVCGILFCDESRHNYIYLCVYIILSRLNIYYAYDMWWSSTFDFTMQWINWYYQNRNLMSPLWRMCHPFEWH